MDQQFYGAIAELYDDVVVDPCFPEWAGFLDALWATGPTPVTRVLDVGCGTGSLAALLVAQGRSVIGVDGSTAMLDQARQRLGPDIDLHHSVLPALPKVDHCDAAISTFDTLNYLGPSAMRATHHAVAQCLRPDGWWVFDLHTRALLEVVAAHPVTHDTSSGWSYTLSNDVDLAAGTCTSTFTARHATTGREVNEVHRQVVFTDTEVKTALADAGFALVDVVDEYSERPRTAQTLRATWIARRR